jgi:hypothetical protein
MQGASLIAGEVAMRIIIPALIACSCSSPIMVAQRALPSSSTIPVSATLEHTQDFSDTLVRITSVRIKPSLKLGLSGKPSPKLGIGADLGTGFCLDAACEFIVTNYHVAAAQVRRVEQQKVLRQFLDTGPDDKDATANYVPGVGVIAFATSRDLAIFELQHSVPHHHGIGYSLDGLRFSQGVDIYGYPKGAINPIRKLARLPAKFKGLTTSGLMAFDYQSSPDKPVRLGGASGGIVVDRKTKKIVGVLCRANETTAVAIPVETLVEFVNKLDPYLAEKIFPASREIPSVTADLYPEFVPPHSDALEHRPEEPHEVELLREKAQLLADNIRNFIAVQTFAWGSGDGDPYAEAAYEVRVIDGTQRFRKYPNGKKELDEVPFSEGVNAVDEWSGLPRMVGKEFRLKIQQAPDALINERRIKVFQYYASVEDNLCGFRVTWDFGFFQVHHKPVDLACHGEVWTDRDLNIIRISQSIDFVKPIADGWHARRAVVNYGWLKKENEARLVPQTIYVEGWRKRRMFWCRGYFKDYQLFSVKARLAVNVR